MILVSFGSYVLSHVAAAVAALVAAAIIKRKMKKG